MTYLTNTFDQWKSSIKNQTLDLFKSPSPVWESNHLCHQDSYFFDEDIQIQKEKAEFMDLFNENLIRTDFMYPASPALSTKYSECQERFQDC